jgi:hypothetical protein
MHGHVATLVAAIGTGQAVASAPLAGEELKGKVVFRLRCPEGDSSFAKREDQPDDEP